MTAEEATSEIKYYDIQALGHVLTGINVEVSFALVIVLVAFSISRGYASVWVASLLSSANEIEFVARFT